MQVVPQGQSNAVCQIGRARNNEIQVNFGCPFYTQCTLTLSLVQAESEAYEETDCQVTNDCQLCIGCLCCLKCFVKQRV